MRFLTRSLLGGVLAALLTVLFLFLAWQRAIAPSPEGGGGARGGPGVERAYVVATQPFEIGAAVPVARGFGEVRSWRTLEIRAPAAGRITELAADFRDGAQVEAGAFLFEIDPRAARRAVSEAELALAQAEADRREAEAARELAAAELEAARSQRVLRAREAERQRNLRGRNLVSDAVVDEANLALAAAEQSVLSRRQAVLGARMRVENGDIAAQRAQIELERAREALEDMRVTAPFAGRLDQIDATLGRRVGVNEKLGVLIDPKALEVGFRVSERDFAALLAQGGSGELAPLEVEVTLGLGEETLEARGELSRAAAVVDSARGGRLVYARLAGEDAAVLRPGDFVEAEVSLPSIDDVAVLPLTAIDAGGRALVIDASGERLEEIALDVIRREVDRALVRDPPEGRRYAIVRLPHLAEGVRVEEPGAEEQRDESGSGEGRRGEARVDRPSESRDG